MVGKLICMLRKLDRASVINCFGYTTTQIDALREHLRQSDYLHYAASLFCPRKIRPAIWALLALHGEVMRAPFLSKEPLAVHIRLAWWRDALMAKPFVPSLHPLLALVEPLLQSGIFSDEEWSALVMSPLVLVDWCVPHDMVEFVARSQQLFAPLMVMLHRLDGGVGSLHENAVKSCCSAQLLLWSRVLLQYNICILPQEILQAYGVHYDEVLSGVTPSESVRNASIFIINFLETLRKSSTGVSKYHVFFMLNDMESLYAKKSFAENKDLVLFDRKQCDARVILFFLRCKLLRVIKHCLLG